MVKRGSGHNNGDMPKKAKHDAPLGVQLNRDAPRQRSLGKTDVLRASLSLSR